MDRYGGIVVQTVSLDITLLAKDLLREATFLPICDMLFPALIAMENEVKTISPR
ncbi:hypothetical protein MNBD_ALPHA03-2074 [hydrothermal vent metagenome]|uniref:Uncharacterized protein n=1 Tax=hydrothermal vent metagenome TaxID=652676 RepID=A0A3B1AU09_9ZZZZ